MLIGVCVRGVCVSERNHCIMRSESLLIVVVVKVVGTQS